jgi:positive regulator of sigma E activity
VAFRYEIRIMAYILPRAVIVLIAWSTTCLIMNTFTAIAPLVFYIAGGVWSLVGLMTFSYMHNLREQTEAEPVRAIAPVRTAAE